MSVLIQGLRKQLKKKATDAMGMVSVPFFIVISTVLVNQRAPVSPLG